MQSEDTALPAVCSDGKKRSARDTDLNDESTSVHVKNHNTCKFSLNLVSNRKKLHPLVGGPYRNSMRLYALTEPVRSTNKTSVGQRVVSAKMLRVKQLQNQLADAHYHLNELANENRLLKALQKRQDSALRKYEGKNAELPRIINSHHEELKVLQTKHKKLRAQYKQTCDLLKEKENEIHSLQAQNKHLMQLNKDRNLEEREKLQTRVSDLTFRIEQQQETIQTLNRKLALESKSLKHQLNAEVAKHKETQKSLQRTLEKLKNLEDFLDNREKRLYSSGRLPVCNKGKTAGSQSLVNLGQSPTGKCKGSQNDLENGSLPKLIRTESSDGKTVSNLKAENTEETTITETMSSLKHVRKFRLQKAYSRGGSDDLLNLTDKSDEEDITGTENGRAGIYTNIEKLRAKRTIIKDLESEDDAMKMFVNNFEMSKEVYSLPKQLMREFAYSSTESEDDAGNNKDARDDRKFESNSLASKSRELHSRLIADEATLTRSTVPNAMAKEKYSASTSEGESAAENRMRTRSVSMDDDVKPGGVSQSERGNIEESTSDDPRLGIDATSFASEAERLDETSSEKLEKLTNRGSDGFSREECGQDEQQRLLDLTKSWTDVQARIKRDREISEIQLKALNEEIFDAKFVLEKRISSLEDSDRSLKEKRLSGKMSESLESYENDHGEAFISQENKFREEASVEGNVEVPHTQQNGVAEVSGENASLNSTDIPVNPRTSTATKESRLVTTKAVEDFTATRGSCHRGSEQFAANNIGRADSTDVKLINYNKQRLLAAMKAIDDNENIDFTSNPKYRSSNSVVRAQTTATENLYRGLPAHARKKDDLLKEIFGDGKVENKIRGGCSKLH